MVVDRRRKPLGPRLGRSSGSGPLVSSKSVDELVAGDLTLLLFGIASIAALLANPVLPARAAQTAARSGCDPHYVSQTCVPIASDVDCAGGEGNGPAYVAGPFEYVGEDIYGLDRDGNGIACEPRPKR